MNEVRIVLGADRSAVAEDHLWAPFPPQAGVGPALLDSLPPADLYVVVVPPERVVFQQVRLPVGPQHKALAALPYLLEDHLIEAPDRYEFFPLSPPVPGGLLPVAALERDWLANARVALARIGRGEVRWVVDGVCWGGSEPGDWMLRLDPRGALLSRTGTEVFRLPAQQIESCLDLALAEAQASRPRRLVLDPGAESASEQSVRRWAAGQRIEIIPAQLTDAWHAGFSAGHVLFAQTRSRFRQALLDVFAPLRWRAVAWLAAGLAVLELVFILAAWAWLETEFSGQKREAAEILRSAAGPGIAVVDPLAQMRRLERDRRHVDGDAAASDFVPLLAAVTGFLGKDVGQLKELSYDGTRLRFVFDRPKLAGVLEPSAVLGPLRRAGFAADAAPSPEAGRWTLSVGWR